MSLPVNCPRCGSSNTVYIAEAETRVCLACNLDYWYSPDDEEVVTSEG